MDQLVVMEHPKKLLPQRRWQFSSRSLFIAVIVVNICFAVAMHVYQSWSESQKLPVPKSNGYSYALYREFQHIGYRMWYTEGDEFFFAVVTGHVDYDPNMLQFQLNFTYNIDTGGELLLDGEPITFSPKNRLLALNPFGEMELLSLTPTEVDIVSTGDANRIWENVVLKRLYRRSGPSDNGTMTGRWTYKDATDRLAFEGDYANGHREGKWTYYYPSGEVRAEIYYVDGERHGDWTYFDQAGTVTRIEEWFENEPVGRTARQSGIGFTEARGPSHSRTVISP